MLSRIRTAGALLLLTSTLLIGQSQPNTPPAPERSTTFSTGSQEVLLDLVVRDKKGRTVRDLEPGDIEIVDDGKPVQLRDLRLIDAAAAGTKSPGGAIVAEGSAAGPKVNPLREIKLITVVFERLSLDGRRLFKQAMYDLLGADQTPNLYLALFTIENRLQLLQPFTNDKALLKGAVDKAVSGAYSSFTAQSNDMQDQLQKRVESSLAAADDAAAGAGSGGSGASGIGGAAASAMLAQLQLNMVRFSANMERDQESQASMFSLLGLVKDQGKLPGRKIVLYFSESFRYSENTARLMPVLINAANRSNVSIYSVDARGLITNNLNSEGTTMMASAAASSKKQAMAALSRQPQVVTPDQVQVFDTVQNALGANTQVGLDTLASGTGGFLISNSNDFRGPIRKALEEVLTYYEASYIPPAMNFDGHFRSISVRTKRPDLTIHTRSGYFALPNTGDSVLYPHEIPLLKALSTQPVPRAFEYRAGVYRFDPRGEELKYAVTLEVPIRSLTAIEDKDKGVYRVHASVMALMKAQDGHVVAKLSRDLPFEGPLNLLPTFQNGNLIQTDYVKVHPGRYTLETAVLDQNGEKVSGRRTSVIVPAPTDKLSISDLVLIRRLDSVDSKEARDANNPMEFQGGRITPTLADSLSAGQKLGLYFVVYAASPDGPAPTLVLDLEKDGKSQGAAEVQLPPADASGRIPYVASIDTNKLQAGDYDVTVRVRQGNLQSTQTASLHLLP